MFIFAGPPPHRKAPVPAVPTRRGICFLRGARLLQLGLAWMFLQLFRGSRFPLFSEGARGSLGWASCSPELPWQGQRAFREPQKALEAGLRRTNRSKLNCYRARVHYPSGSPDHLGCFRCPVFEPQQAATASATASPRR